MEEARTMYFYLPTRFQTSENFLKDSTLRHDLFFYSYRSNFPQDLSLQSGEAAVRR